MRKRKRLKKSIYPSAPVWFTITPEMIKRMEDYLNSTRLEWRRGLTLVPDDMGGVFAGPTKEN